MLTFSQLILRANATVLKMHEVVLRCAVIVATIWRWVNDLLSALVDNVYLHFVGMRLQNPASVAFMRFVIAESNREGRVLLRDLQSLQVFCVHNLRLPNHRLRVVLSAFVSRWNAILEVRAILQRDFRVICDGVEEDSVRLVALVLVCWHERHRTLSVLRLGHPVKRGLQKRLLRPIRVDHSTITFSRSVLCVASVLAQTRVTLEHARMDTTGEELGLGHRLMARGLRCQACGLGQSDISGLLAADAEDFAASFFCHDTTALGWALRHRLLLFRSIKRKWFLFLFRLG